MPAGPPPQRPSGHSHGDPRQPTIRILPTLFSTKGYSIERGGLGDGPPTGGLRRAWGVEASGGSRLKGPSEWEADAWMAERPSPSSSAAFSLAVTAKGSAASWQIGARIVGRQYHVNKNAQIWISANGLISGPLFSIAIEAGSVAIFQKRRRRPCLDGDYAARA
jgi:hypothetical protein